MSSNTDHSSTLQLFFFAGVMIAFWHSELFFKLVSYKDKWQHTLLNLHFLVTATLIQLPLTFLVLKVGDWTALNKWGMIYHLPFSQHFFVKFLAGIFLMDFWEYAYHYAMHKFGYLWKIHLIHHTDRTLDVSTTIREHPAETFVRVSFMVLTVFITGVPIAILLLRQFIQSFLNIACHTSISLPEKIEKYLNYVFITPGLHKVHHHESMPYTDSNFGDILSIWDRLFGTYRTLEQSKICYGIDTVKVNEITTFSQLLIYPFKKEKLETKNLASKQIGAEIKETTL